METSFPDRYNVLRRLKIFKIFILLIPILIGIGCDSKKDYHVDPVPVFSKVIDIDSTYTTVRNIPTGGSSRLFCGKKDVFDSYSILKFDSIPGKFDSLFIQLESDSSSVVLTLFKMKEEWSEDSVHLWNNIGSLIDTLNPLRVEAVNDSNPRILIGDSNALSGDLIDEINSFGLAVHTDDFYSFSANRSKLKIKTQDTLVDSTFSCLEDAYIVKNPFQDTIFSDSLLVGRGLSIRSHIIIPRDSLPQDLKSVASSKLFLNIEDSLSLNLEVFANNSGFTFYPVYTEGNDSLRIEMGLFFKEAAVDSLLHIQVKTTSETGGIGFEKLGEGLIKFIWVEFPR